LNIRSPWAWSIAAVVSAFACWLAAVHSTPIDRALPFIALVLTGVAAASNSAILIAVPLLIGGEIAIPDERLRLLWFGLVAAASIGTAFMNGSWTRWRGVLLTVAAIVLLRWIPAPPMILRELFLIVLAIAIVAALRWTPLAVAIATATALFTPAIPLRTFALPLLVLLASALVRFFGFGFVTARTVAAVTTAVMLMFFPWSGVLARAPKLALLQGLPHPAPRTEIRTALRPGQSVTLDIPAGARFLILSGANVPRLSRDTVIGRIDPGGDVRIGDIVDWGALRREHFYNSRNRLPEDPAGLVRDYGYAAWVDGGGRVIIAGATVRVTADERLPADARLQIEAFQ
jgi:hypothetical protein